MQRRVIKQLAEIEIGPRLPGCVNPTGSASTYRAHVGDWRFVYKIDDGQRNVFVTIVAHRSQVYLKS